MTRIGRRAAATAALLTALTLPAIAQRGPAPEITHLPEEVLALACAPRLTFEIPNQSLRITGGQDTLARRVWAPGDLLTINGGSDHGIEVGQEYYVRRLQTDAYQRPSRTTPGSIRTAGWIRVYAVDREMSLATVRHACDAIDVGDYLEPFAPPVVPKPSADTSKPQRDNYARIVLGQDFRRAFGKGDFFVIDRGRDHGIEPGDRFVVYRDRLLAQNFLYELGEAVAMEVGEETATLQATVTRDAFAAGDYVAIRKAAQPE